MSVISRRYASSHEASVTEEHFSHETLENGMDLTTIRSVTIHRDFCPHKMLEGGVELTNIMSVSSRRVSFSLEMLKGYGFDLNYACE